MRKPVAQPVGPAKPADEASAGRAPQIFSAEDIPEAPEPADEAGTALEPAPPPRRRNWLLRIALSAFSLVVSLSLGLAAQQLIADLFARYEWLGWVGTAIVAVLVFAVLALAWREWLSVRRLNKLGRLRERAAAALDSNRMAEGEAVVSSVSALYAGRPDLARAQSSLMPVLGDIVDASDRIQAAERALMTPLDARARALTAAAARRVTLVTAISPRALVDIAFVAFESIRLARRIAVLYGVQPGLFGSWRLFGAILGHLAVTGGVALGDSVIQQLLGQGLAARLSARLGEGLVNGLMTVRVGIAAMRVTRPLPFSVLRQPVVMDFVPELVKVEKTQTKTKS
ncbi:MAG: YcjF family protein [Alphaproteobacteria bacterium]|nr:YcjF family protein [Alphaproteobacteria bacterium]